jgi:RNA polymerase sigma-70 factor, ECF subfamily
MRRVKPSQIRDAAPPLRVTLMVNDGAPSDVDVVARVLGGDGEAFGILIRRYEPGLLRFATRMLGNPDAAADAVAESLVRAYRHLAQCRDPGRLRSWLYRITGNRCRSHLARRRTNDISLSEAPPLADGSDAWAALERGEQVALVERALAALSPEKREAFVLKHVEGMSYEEMAAVTGARIPTLKMRVHRAREALLAALEELV